MQVQPYNHRFLFKQIRKGYSNAKTRSIMKLFVAHRVRYLIMLAIIGTSVTARAQKGSIKIFSEIKGISVYLDERLQPTAGDVITIDSVTAGTHYIKASKDNIIVYSELATVQPNKVTIVLIKNSQQVKNKLLESKTDEIQEYKSKKLDIILSQNYVTQTKGVTSSIYFPGYYITTGNAFNNSFSTTTAYTDWKIILGGNKEISDLDFANIVGDEQIKADYARAWKSYNKQVTTGAIIGIPSLIIAGIIFADILGSKPFLNISSTAEATIGTAGIVGSVIGYSITMGAKEPQGHFTTVDKASREAYEYNQALKKQLGLPENFEPDK